MEFDELSTWVIIPLQEIHPCPGTRSDLLFRIGNALKDFGQRQFESGKDVRAEQVSRRGPG